MFQVCPDTMISEILQHAPQAVPMFEEIGMHCMGCALASGENVMQACAAHGVNPEDFIERLNQFIADNA